MGTTKQYCKVCQNDRTLDDFADGVKTCNRYRAKQLRRYHNNPEHFQQKEKEYAENNPAEMKEAQQE